MKSFFLYQTVAGLAVFLWEWGEGGCERGVRGKSTFLVLLPSKSTEKKTHFSINIKYMKA